MRADEEQQKKREKESTKTTEPTQMRKGTKQATRMAKRTLRSLIKWLPYTVWALIFISFLVSLSKSGKDEPPTTTEVQELKVYNQQKDRFAKWERKDAVEFGINQLANTINYLFLAAAAILGFVAKILIDPMVEPKNKVRFRPGISILLMHAALGCFFSLIYGFFGHLYLPMIADRQSFSIYDEVGISALFQIFSLFLAGLLLMIATISMVYQQLRANNDQSKLREEEHS